MGARSCDQTVCAHSLELEFLNEKYLEVLAHNSSLRDQLNSRIMQDPMKYLKLCEELTKVSKNLFAFSLMNSINLIIFSNII
jgi:hypothetical protein